MTSKLKCPFCGGELYGCIGHPYCRNEKCEMCDEMMPQELLDLLDRTRKALDVAIQYIKHTQRVEPFWFNRLANKTLDEIKTALEHKE